MNITWLTYFLFERLSLQPLPLKNKPIPETKIHDRYEQELAEKLAVNFMSR